MKRKTVTVFLVIANEVKTPFSNERNRCAHLSSRKVNQRRVIIFIAAAEHTRFTVRTESELIKKAQIYITNHRLHLHRLKIQETQAAVLNKAEPSGVGTKGRYGKRDRSEEHTSELQSHSFISYAA